MSEAKTWRGIDISQPVSILIPSFDELSCSGVYFLHDGAEVVYVGQARNIRRRFAEHIGDGAKRFDCLSYIKCPVDYLADLEAAYIAKLLPRYNKCHLASDLRLVGAPVEQPAIGSIEMTATEAAAFLGMDSHTFYATIKREPLLSGRRRSGGRRGRIWRAEDLRAWAASR